MSVLKIYRYSASSIQKLKNVAIVHPSLIKVYDGCKVLYWNDRVLNILPGQVVFLSGGQRITFDNEVCGNRFRSIQISLLSEPKKVDRINSNVRHTPLIDGSDFINNIFDMAINLELSNKSDLVQEGWFNLLCNYLKDFNELDSFFGSNTCKLSQQLRIYFAKDLNYDHKLEDYAHKFSMSRSTFIRKLKDENTTFGAVLKETRLSCSLCYLQDGLNAKDVSKNCGFSSFSRFKNDFLNQFNFSIEEYIDSMGSIC